MTAPRYPTFEDFLRDQDLRVDDQAPVTDLVDQFTDDAAPPRRRGRPRKDRRGTVPR